MARMPTPSNRVPIAAALAGAALLIHGAALVYHPLGYLTAGLLLLAAVVRRKVAG